MLMGKGESPNSWLDNFLVKNKNEIFEGGNIVLCLPL